MKERGRREGKGEKVERDGEKWEKGEGERKGRGEGREREREREAGVATKRTPLCGVSTYRANVSGCTSFLLLSPWWRSWTTGRRASRASSWLSETRRSGSTGENSSSTSFKSMYVRTYSGTSSLGFCSEDSSSVFFALGHSGWLEVWAVWERREFFADGDSGRCPHHQDPQEKGSPGGQGHPRSPESAGDEAQPPKEDKDHRGPDCSGEKGLCWYVI